MSQHKPDSETRTFAEFVEHRHSTDREVAVYVEGELENDPPLGNGAATWVANRLASDDEEILRVDPKSAADDDVSDNTGVVVIELAPDPPRDEWEPVMRRLLSRVQSGVDIVVLVDTDDVPWFCKELADVRVVTNGIDGPMWFYQVRMNAYEGEVFYEQFDGSGYDT